MITISPLGGGPKSTNRSPTTTMTPWIVRFHSTRNAMNPLGSSSMGRRRASRVREVQALTRWARSEGPIAQAIRPMIRATNNTAQVAWINRARVMSHAEPAASLLISLSNPLMIAVRPTRWAAKVSSKASAVPKLMIPTILRRLEVTHIAPAVRMTARSGRNHPMVLIA